jgi:amino acid adenylation domain-containing protein
MNMVDRAPPYGSQIISVPEGPHFERWPEEALDSTVPARFEEMVRRYPQRLAVQVGARTIDYETLNKGANRLGHAILGRLGATEEPVALLLGHGASAIQAILAVLKAGKFYVALDPAYPPARLAAMLADGDIPLIITDRQNLKLTMTVCPDGAEVLNVEPLEPGLSVENPKLPLEPDRLFNLTYTSGSTGQPKGVLQTHRNILHNALEATHLLKFCRDDRFALVMPLSFGAAAADVCESMLNGAALLLYDLKAQGSGGFSAWLRRMGVTVYHSVPTVYRHLLATLAEDETLPDMRIVQLGGESVRCDDIALFQRHFSLGCVLMNNLGTTETYLATAYLVDHTTRIDEALVPVGFPLNGRRVLVLNEVGEPVEGGQIGQIAIQSRYLSPGYWRQPETTAAVFLPDPTGGDERIYLTGDLGRLRPDGCLEHLGRQDEMIKIRGQRVEPATVETALLTLPGVTDAVVVARAGPVGDTRLVAYIVAEQGGAPEPAALRLALLERLPEHMVPAAYVTVNRLPLLPFGKVNRRALPAPEWGRSQLGVPFKAPQNGLERKLVQIWEACLGVRPVGVQDNFFELGGHSLLVARVCAEIEGAIGKTVPPVAIFQAPTVAQLADALRQEGMWKAVSALIPLQAGDGLAFFCVPGNLGNVYSDLSDLARHMGPGQAFYGLQDSVHQPKRIEEMAAAYLEEIRAVQPEGPYLLGGICSGGVVAYEMAQQLQAHEQSVALLAMVESPYLGQPGPLSYLGCAAFVVNRLKRRTASSGSKDGNRSLNEWRAFLRLKFKLVANDWALRRYNPAVYPGCIHLFLTEPSLRDGGTRFHYWRELARGGTQVHQIPGTHDSIVGAYTQVDAAQMAELAEQLRRCIAAYQEIPHGPV